MIQLNLLPDIKLQYLKAQRARRIITAIAILITVLSVTLLIVLFGINRLQKQHLSDLSKDIKSKSAALRSQPDAEKILTVQNQLNSLTNLHSAKPAASRIFDDLNNITPAQISLSDYSLDFATQQINITGSAESLNAVNKYIDTLKFTKYVEGDTSTLAFKDVVLDSFGITTGSNDVSQPATFSVKFTYDPIIYDITHKIRLSVPTQVTTRSQLAQPTELFKAAPKPATTTKGTN